MFEFAYMKHLFVAMIRPKLIILFLITLFLCGCEAISSVKEGGNYMCILKFPMDAEGIYETTDTYMSYSGSGVSVTIVQPEESFSLWIEDLAGDPLNGNWMHVIVGDTLHSRIKLKQGKNLYPIFVKNNVNKLITFVKVTEPHVGEVRLYGLELSEAIIPKPVVTSHAMRILFIGNSITCGYGNMISIPAPPEGNPLTGFHTENENAYQSYAMQTARKLQASPTLVCFSGKGMYRNFDSDTNETMPKIFDRMHLQKKDSKTWSDSYISQDIIVINLGTNDYFGESQNKPLKDSVFVQTYIQFVERLISHYPDARIVCINSPMLNDAWPAGKMCWTRLQTSIQKVQEHFQAKGNTQIYRFSFQPQSAPFGEDYHPSLATHTKMAEELTTFIQTVVNK